ncbi:transposase [Undibacterium sp. 5I1]|uniref:RNA-guided endonuclease InsQ/TnpB family protein n=1 Tax=Undibacterium sp. 5I1 TaxID=3048590 RepID=UPI002AB5915C|nr:transposase [Undibacterium sp. 5I1]MDY7537889.1 transposase [Undibacterium sp. 5I1]
MPRDSSTPPNKPVLNTRVLRLRIKDKHAAVLRDRAMWANQVWNYCNDLQQQVWRREKRLLSGYDFAPFTKGAGKEGIPLHSQTIQAISEEYATRRKQFKKIKLRWRVSRGNKRSLGWIPFKASALSYRNGQLWMSGIDTPLCLWDSYGLSQYQLGAGNLSEDARGRWYINITVKVARQAPVEGKADVGIDLGLKDFAGFSDPVLDNVEAQKYYRGAEVKLGMAQRAKKKRLVKSIHAKIANRRKDHHHQLSTKLVRRYGAIFVGNVNASSLVKTKMAKSVLDAGWSQFRTMLSYKCDDAGVWFEEVNEAYSTQDCSACFARSGPKGLKDLGIREWTCPHCGTMHDRDRNAAKNILRRGRATLVAGIPFLSV